MSIVKVHRLLPGTSVACALIALHTVTTTASENTDTLRTFPQNEIVITASRIGAEILKVPIAVSVVHVQPDSRNISLDHALFSVPGLHVQSRSGGGDVRLTIRGFGARGNGDRSNAATIRGIRVLLDGIPVTEPDGRTALDLIDLASVDNIEIARSNSSTVFGNASGGVVNLQTLTASDHPQVEARYFTGSFGLRKNSLSIAAPFSAGSVAIFFSNSEFAGWRQNSHSASSHLNSSITTAIGEGTHLSLFLAGAHTMFSIPGALTATEYSIDPERANPVYKSRQERRDNKIGRAAVKVHRVLSEREHVEVLGFYQKKILERSERNTFRNFDRYHAGGGFTYHRQTPGWWIISQIVAGIDGDVQDGQSLFYTLVNGEKGDTLKTDKNERASTTGVFAQMDLNPLDRFIASVGLRGDRQRYTITLRDPISRIETATDRMNFFHVSPRLAILFQLSDHHSIYLNWSGGLEVPAFNEVDPPPSLPNAELNPLLKPMTSKTLEAGIKGFEQFDKAFLSSIQYGLAIYQILIENEIVPYDGGSWYFSAGESQRLGVEGEIAIEFAKEFSCRCAVTCLASEYLHYQNNLGNFAGNDVPGIPPVIAQTRFRYSIDRTQVDLEINHCGEYFADDANKAVVDPYTIFNLDASTSVKYGIMTLSVTGGISNLMNTPIMASAFINPLDRTVWIDSRTAITEPAYIEPGLPRTWHAGLRASVDF